MELGVLERVSLLQVLPVRVEDNYITYRIINDLKRDLSFSEDDLKNFDIKIDGEKITWDVTKEEKKDVTKRFGEKISHEIITTFIIIDLSGIKENLDDLIEHANLD